MYEKLVDLIIDAAQELNEEMENKIDVASRSEARLFGKGGVLDSIGLVNLIVAVEQAIEDKYNAILTIADEKAMSQKRSPFRTIGSLAAYIEKLINGEI